MEPDFLRSGLIHALQLLLFSTDTLKDYIWAPDLAISVSRGTNQQLVSPLPYFLPLCHWFCMLYSNEPAQGCFYPKCKFKCVCCHCMDDPNVGDKSHKALMCPYRSYHSTASRVKMWSHLLVTINHNSSPIKDLVGYRIQHNYALCYLKLQLL